MRLSTSELRSRAAVFARNHRAFRDERRDSQTFWNNFFQDVFGVPRTRIAVYEQSVEKLSGTTGSIDLFIPGKLVIEQKSLGRNLSEARLQALDYTQCLADAEMPRRVLACDFRSWDLTDLESGQRITFDLDELPRYIDRFAFVLGREVVPFRDQNPVNIKAAELVGLLHDRIEASGYHGHKLEVFLTRIVFCLFADDTGIFEPKDILLDLLEERTRPDGTDTGDVLNKLFAVLNTPEAGRSQTLDPAFARFPYVNGRLFGEYFPAPDFDADMRAALINACRFDWTPISPAIFGSLFQSVMEPRERRAKGAHYTTEKNILKLIGPLFKDDLRAEFERIKARKTGRERALEAFHDKLAGLTFFDPACGCGNFLVITYRELRTLENEVIAERFGHRFRRAGMSQADYSFNVASLSRVDVNQFHGIEIGEFPARIAETALWMMDHLMNLRLSELVGDLVARIPLRAAPHIVHADALEIDWADVLPPERCSYVLGNPPFVGAKYQTPEQRAQVRRIAGLGKSGGTLDYVAAWLIKAGHYVRGRARIGFVATNSITQGEQVAQLWPVLFDRCGLEIGFAHRTFEWGSEARGKAHVHVVILGLDRRATAPRRRRLFSYPDIRGDPVETVHAAISPYLIDAARLADPHLVVKEAARPINGMPRIVIGSKPIDGGHYIFTRDEMRAFLATEPEAERFFRPFVGSREFLNGGERFILYLGDATPRDLHGLRRVREVIGRVRAYRLGEVPAKGKAEGSGERGLSSLQLATTPTRFHVTVVPDRPFLLFPRVSSEKRQYAPIAWVQPPTIPSDSSLIALDARLDHFGLVTSSMHVAWFQSIGGRLESRYRYSAGLVYNTFPLPPGADLSRLAPLAHAVLNARAVHPGTTLAQLYDPDLMPPDLRRAHAALDRAVDRLYRPSGFASDRDRVEHLLGLYEKMANPLLAPPGRRRRRA